MARLAFSRSFWLLISALVVAGVVAHGWRLQVQEPPPLPEAPPPRAEYYLRDALVDVMDENGRLSYRIRTSEMLRFSDHSTQLIDVEIESLGGQRGVWQLEAGQAHIGKGQEMMELSGGVKMQTTGPQGKTRLTTETLSVELKGKRLKTAAPVSIAGPGYEAKANGMQAAFDTRDMTLLNRVRTRYVP